MNNQAVDAITVVFCITSVLFELGRKLWRLSTPGSSRFLKIRLEEQDVVLLWAE
jgi:hypothetical protein